MKTRYLYMAGITERGDDDWIWQGNVSAYSRHDAEALLRNYIAKKRWHTTKKLTGHIAQGHRIKTKVLRGVYEI